MSFIEKAKIAVSMFTPTPSSFISSVNKIFSVSSLISVGLILIVEKTGGIISSIMVMLPEALLLLKSLSMYGFSFISTIEL